MKHLKSYESTSKYNWKNIYEEDGKLYINVYKLIYEMEETVRDLGKNEILKKEDEYRYLLETSFIGKVISFQCSDCGETHTGICEDVEFHTGFEDPGNNRFQVDFIQFVIEDIDDSHAIDDDKITVHLDIDPELYRNIKRYNI
jgi:hypothetical protein